MSCWTPRVSPTISVHSPELSWKFPRIFSEIFMCPRGITPIYPSPPPILPTSIPPYPNFNPISPVYIFIQGCIFSPLDSLFRMQGFVVVVGSCVVVYNSRWNCKRTRHNESFVILTTPEVVIGSIEPGLQVCLLDFCFTFIVLYYPYVYVQWTQPHTKIKHD